MTNSLPTSEKCKKQTPRPLTVYEHGKRTEEWVGEANVATFNIGFILLFLLLHIRIFNMPFVLNYELCPFNIDAVATTGDGELQSVFLVCH